VNSAAVAVITIRDGGRTGRGGQLIIRLAIIVILAEILQLWHR
jgi:hypothetical protein